MSRDEKDKEDKLDHERWEVVITDCDHGFVTLEQEEMDRIGAGMSLAQLKSEADVIRVCGEADGLLNQYAPLTRAVLSQLPRCKVIAKYGVEGTGRPSGCNGSRHHCCGCTGLLF